MNPAETTRDLLYPTQLMPYKRGPLTSWRDGVMGQELAPDPYGQSTDPYRNGVFGPGLSGNPAEQEVPISGHLHAYRSGVFDFTRPSQGAPDPNRVVAYDEGIFGGPVGQSDADTQKYWMYGAAAVGLVLVGLFFLRK